MKKYTAGSIKEYINDLAARKPVPEEEAQLL
jgi:hypothetical protein